MSKSPSARRRILTVVGILLLLAVALWLVCRRREPPAGGPGAVRSAQSALSPAERLKRAKRFAFDPTKLPPMTADEPAPVIDEIKLEKEEVCEGEEEAITFCYLTNPKKIQGDTCVKGMDCIKMKLGAPDESGRAKPIPVEGSDFNIDADTIIEAISQEPDLEGVDGGKFKVSKWNTYVVDGNGMTSMKGVFAGGDCVNGASTIVEALKSMRAAAIGVHKYLMGTLPPGVTEEPKEACAVTK